MTTTQEKLRAIEAETVRPKMTRGEAREYREELSFLCGMLLALDPQDANPSTYRQRRQYLGGLMARLEDAIDGSEADGAARDLRHAQAYAVELAAKIAEMQAEIDALKSARSQTRNACLQVAGATVAMVAPDVAMPSAELVSVVDRILDRVRADSSPADASESAAPPPAVWTAEDQALLDAAKSDNDMPF